MAKKIKFNSYQYSLFGDDTEPLVKESEDGVSELETPEVDLQETKMLKYISFGSGSSGNCYYLFTEQYGILIDLGIGIRSFKKYFREYGLSFNKVNAILITHDHTDHIKAAGAFSTEFHVPVYATEAVHAGMLRNRFMQKKVV